MNSTSSSSSISPIIDPARDQFNRKNRILQIPCDVCNDFSYGMHYGAYVCDGCSGFFERSIRTERNYECKAANPGLCVIERTNRKRCRSCRLQKCFTVGMSKVQNERGPRNSTAIRQLNPCSEVLAKIGRLPFLFDYINPSVMAVYANAPFVPNSSQLFPSMPPLPSSQADERTFQDLSAAHVIRNVREMRQASRFLELTVSDQLLLVGGCWKECFLLSVAQHMSPIYFHKIVLAHIAERGYDHYTPQLIKDVELLGHIVQIAVIMRLDSREYDLLREVLLFQKALNERLHATYIQSIPRGDILIQNGFKIEMLYEAACAKLFTHVVSRSNKSRYHEIFRLIPHLRAAPVYALEEVFFRKIVGNVSMMTVLSELYIAGRI